MKTLAISAAAAMLGLAAVTGTAFAGDTVLGHDENYIEASLKAQGVVASEFDEWSGYIRAYVPGANGGTSMMFFDAETFQPVRF